MGKLVLQITVSLFALTVLAGSLSEKLDAMSWPSEDAVLLRNFGSNNNGNPVLGMVFSGGTDILAAENGEIIFSRSKNDTASRLPSPLGAWTAVDHGDGLISIYSRYADILSTDRPSIETSETQVEKSQQIASSGISGWSAQEGFYFVIFDRRDRHWINPAMIITPAQRTRPVQIVSVNLRNTDGVQVQTNNLSQGRYTVHVNAVSSVLSAAPLSAAPLSAAPLSAAPLSAAQGSFLAPQRIVCMINGAEAGSLNFEAFSARDGVLMIYRNGLVPAKQIYAAFPAFETAEISLTRGQANLEIIVQDIAGNTRNLVNRLIVN